MGLQSNHKARLKVDSLAGELTSQAETAFGLGFGDLGSKQ